MSINERTRHGLYEAARQAMGDEHAETLMELLPPVGWADVATTRDLGALDARIDARFQQIDARFQQVDARFQQVDARFDILEARLGERLERELRRQSARFTASLFAALTLFGVADRLL